MSKMRKLALGFLGVVIAGAVLMLFLPGFWKSMEEEPQLPETEEPLVEEPVFEEEEIPEKKVFYKEEMNLLDPELLSLWLGLPYEEACAAAMENGMEYRLVAVDRACGSSFYVLLGTEDKGKTCSFLNKDPYNGSGGEARWLTFLDRELGFSCLAWSGGAYGSLYRTEDGGASFAEVEYPSANAELPDGTHYNPFVMPEEVYEEDGVLYLIAGQGPDGDYRGGDRRCRGLYRSLDRGQTFSYEGEIRPENPDVGF